MVYYKVYNKKYTIKSIHLWWFISEKNSIMPAKSKGGGKQPKMSKEEKAKQKAAKKASMNKELDAATLCWCPGLVSSLSPGSQIRAGRTSGKERMKKRIMEFGWNSAAAIVVWEDEDHAKKQGLKTLKEISKKYTEESTRPGLDLRFNPSHEQEVKLDKRKFFVVDGWHRTLAIIDLNECKGNDFKMEWVPILRVIDESKIMVTVHAQFLNDESHLHNQTSFLDFVTGSKAQYHEWYRRVYTPEFERYQLETKDLSDRAIRSTCVCFVFILFCSATIYLSLCHIILRT